MRELDLLLSDYLAAEYGRADLPEQASFRLLLDCADPQILAYLTKQEVPDDAGLQRIVRKLRRYRST